MESTALQQAFDTCQNNKAAWLQRKNELAAAEQEYLRLQSGEGRNVSRLDELRNIIEVHKTAAMIFFFILKIPSDFKYSISVYHYTIHY